MCCDSQRPAGGLILFFSSPNSFVPLPRDLVSDDKVDAAAVVSLAREVPGFVVFICCCFSGNAWSSAKAISFYTMTAFGRIYHRIKLDKNVPTLIWCLKKTYQWFTVVQQCADGGGRGRRTQAIVMLDWLLKSSYAKRETYNDYEQSIQLFTRGRRSCSFDAKMGVVLCPSELKAIKSSGSTSD